MILCVRTETSREVGENEADYAVVVDQVMQDRNGSEHLNSIEVTMQIDVNWTRSGCSVVISGTHG